MTLLDFAAAHPWFVTLWLLIVCTCVAALVDGITRRK